MARRPATVIVVMLPLLPGVALAASLAAPARPAAVADANVAQICQWPTVAAFRAGESKCTGTLVHPRVIVTAAHCIIDSAAGGIRFGEQFQPAASIVHAERCGFEPEFAATGAPSSDIGWCVLSEPVEGIPPTPLLMGCETELLHEGDPAVIVGFGVSEEDDQFGTKRYAFTVLDSDLRADGTVWVGDEEVGGCFGDSGGPAFVQLPGGTWHAVGVLAFGQGCGQGPVLYRSLHDRIGWLEEQTGFDLSPCHDAEGHWAPGPECGDVATSPLAGGQWQQLCAGALAAAPVCPSSNTEGTGSTTMASEAEAGPDTIGSTSEGEPASRGDDPSGCGCYTGAAGGTSGWAWMLLLGLGLGVGRRASKIRRA